MRGLIRANAAVLAVLVALLAAPDARAEPPLAPIPAECATPGADGAPPIGFPNLVRAMAERQKIVVLAVGSSVLRNSGPGGDYYGLVERFLETTFKGLDVTIVQRGVSGELARDAAERIRLEVARSSPDVVFWQVGTADAMAGIDPEETRETVRSTIRWLAEHQVDTVLIGLHYTPSLRDDPQYQAMRRAITEVARSEGVLRIRRYEVGETLDRLRRLPSDAAPITDYGAIDDHCVAEYLARALATGLFAKRRPAGLDKPTATPK